MAWNADEARAARREHLGESFTFVYEGETFTVLTEEDWDLDLNVYLEAGRFGDVLAGMMADGEFDRMKALRRPTLGDAKAIFIEAQKFYGYGESPGE